MKKTVCLLALLLSFLLAFASCEDPGSYYVPDETGTKTQTETAAPEETETKESAQTGGIETPIIPFPSDN